jgi:hypothetical protein
VLGRPISRTSSDNSDVAGHRGSRPTGWYGRAARGVWGRAGRWWIGRPRGIGARPPGPAWPARVRGAVYSGLAARRAAVARHLRRSRRGPAPMLARGPSPHAPGTGPAVQLLPMPVAAPAWLMPVVSLASPHRSFVSSLDPHHRAGGLSRFGGAETVKRRVRAAPPGSSRHRVGSVGLWWRWDSVALWKCDAHVSLVGGGERPHTGWRGFGEYDAGVSFRLDECVSVCRQNMTPMSVPKGGVYTVLPGPRVARLAGHMGAHLRCHATWRGQRRAGSTSPKPSRRGGKMVC